MEYLRDINEAKIEKRMELRRKFSRLMLIIPVVILALLILSAIFAPLLAPYSPTEIAMTERLQPPSFLKGGSPKHFLGTDSLGRDVFSRIIYGARISLSFSLIVIFITGTVGTILGIISGYFGGRLDSFIMRFTDVALSIPAILIAIILAVGLGPSFKTIVIASSILGWSGYARVIRGEAMRLREVDFVAQARIIGSSRMRIMIKHIFPNVINPLIIIATMMVGLMIIIEATLSYLGAGIPPPNPSWGAMVNDGRNYLETAWWISFFPGFCIGLVVLSCNYLGDWIRDKLDPRLRRL
ncbi:MAG: ABC transporter permease [Spirochaetes bacterium]|nr:ABC transporter permease [Spirochaetota bacterium]